MPSSNANVLGWTADACREDGTIWITNLKKREYDGSNCSESEQVVSILANYFPESAYPCFENLVIVCRSNMPPQYSIPDGGAIGNDCRLHLHSDLWKEPGKDIIMAVFHEALHRAHHFLDKEAYMNRCKMTLGQGQTDAEEVLTISGHDMIGSAKIAENLYPYNFSENALRLRLGCKIRENHDDKNGRLPNPIDEVLIEPAVLPPDIVEIVREYMAPVSGAGE